MRKKDVACYRCGIILTGFRTRFCTDSCYKKFKSERSKLYSLKYRFRCPEMPCEICGAIFKPLRKDVTACSPVCSQIKAKRKQQEKRVRVRKLAPVKPMGRIKPIHFDYEVTFHNNPLFVNSKKEAHTSLKSAVREYVKAGGLIERQPTLPGAKIPAVNIKFGFECEEVSGFGYLHSEEKIEEALLDQFDGMT